MHLTTRRLPVLLVLALAIATQAIAAPIISPRLRDVRPGGLIGNLAVVDVPGVGQTIDLIITGSVSDAALEAVQASIGTRLPDGTRTVRIPVSRLMDLAKVPGIHRISASYKCKKLNDVSVPTTNATPGYWTHSGAGVFAGNAGANVIVGLVDTGIDWTHDDFKKTDGTTRILYIWDQNDAVGPHPLGFAYGSEWTAANINAATPREHDFDGHGTHVMGTAAGDGSKTGNGQPAYRFIGMAPKADIIVVATTFSLSAVLDGVNYIFQKAAAAGKSAVVNLSLGTQFGAHDGTETFDTALSALSGAGKIVVAAAGNEGGQALHALQLVPPGPAQTVTFNVPSYTAAAGASNDLVLIDAYYPAAANMQVTLTSPGPTPVTVGPVALGGTGSNASSLAGNIYVENGFTPSPSGDRNVYIQIYDSNSARPPRIGAWTVTLTPVSTSAGTQFDAWLADVELGTAGAAATWTSDVDEHDLVASPGSAAQAVTAGAWITKGSWPGIDGFNHSYVGLTSVGTLAYFSSPGPLRNGAQKPDITGPGSAIVSSKSIDASFSTALINPDGVHYTEVGTSMAAPHVTGAVALLLGNQPTLTPAQVKTKLYADAVVDGFTGAVPNAQWGYGKLRILNVDATPPTITVTAPNGGESWPENSVQNITWTAADNVGVTSITLEYSTNGGGSWNPIASGEANDGTYAWTLPSGASSNDLVRATAFDAATNSAQDQSNAAFSITSIAGVPPSPTYSRVTFMPSKPNPFSASTAIGFGLPTATHVRIHLYTVDGRLVRTLADQTYPAGYNEVRWDGRSDGGRLLSSGLYFCRVEAGDIHQTSRIALSH